MKYLKFFIVILALIGLTGPVNAEILKGQKLRRAVSGKTIYLSVAMGIELPIKYRSGGIMFGKMKGLASIIPNNIPKKDKGRWWITKNRLCQAWNKWLNRKSYCYKLRKVRGTVFWHRNDGASGTARIVAH